MTKTSMIRKLTLRSSKNFAQDPVVKEFEVGHWFPYWLRYLLTGLLLTCILLGPAIFHVVTKNTNIYFVYSSQNALTHLSFVISLLSGLWIAGLYLTVAFISFIAFAARITEKLSGSPIMNDEQLLIFFQGIVLRRHIGAIIGTFLVIVTLLLIYGDTTSILDDATVVWSTSNYVIRAAFGMLILFSMLFLKQIIVQNIATNFYRQYYAKKIEKDLFSIGMLRKFKSFLRISRRKLAKSQKTILPETAQSTQLPPTETLSQTISEGSKSMHSLDERLSDKLASEMIQELAHDKCHIKVEDLCQVLSPEEATRLFSILDSGENGDLTRNELAAGWLRVQTEHHEHINAVAQKTELVEYLDRAATILTWIFSFLLFLALFKATFGALLAVISAAGTISLLFFKDMSGNVFKSIVFVFGLHPFDVGDVIVVNDNKYTIKTINLLTTTAIGAANDLVYLDNIKLAAMPIGNIRRSDNQGEDFEFYFDSKTTNAQLDELERQLNQYVEQNTRDFVGTIMIKDIKLENSETIKVCIKLSHRSNFYDGNLRDSRSRKFSDSITKMIADLGIQLGRYPHKLR